MLLVAVREFASRPKLTSRHVRVAEAKRVERTSRGNSKSVVHSPCARRKRFRVIDGGKSWCSCPSGYTALDRYCFSEKHLCAIKLVSQFEPSFREVQHPSLVDRGSGRIGYFNAMRCALSALFWIARHESLPQLGPTALPVPAKNSNLQLGI